MPYLVPISRQVGLAFVFALVCSVVTGCQGQRGEAVSGSQAQALEDVPPTGHRPASSLTMTPLSAFAAIQKAYDQYGIDDPRSVDRYQMIVATCEAGRPVNGPAADAKKNAAAEQLEKFCEGFDAQTVAQPTVRLRSFLIHRGATEGEVRDLVSDARNVIRDPEGRSQLEAIGAAMLLIDLNAFPSQQSFGVDKAELIDAYGAASTLRKCRRDGCGPGSFEVITMCSEKGCDPAQNYEQALREVSSPRRMRLVEALVAM